MTQDLALRAVNILTPDITQSVSFYCQLLEMQFVGRYGVDGLYDFALLQDSFTSTNTFIRFHGPPYSGWMEAFFQDHGPMISYLTLTVEDVDSWANKMREMEIEILSLPESSESKRHMYIRDPAGVVLELITHFDFPFSYPDPIVQSDEHSFGYRLSHTNITCHDIQALEKFYVDQLGMKLVHDASEDGMIFLADPTTLADKDHDVFPLELFGPPGLWESDLHFLEEHGAGLQYLCFAVDDVDRAYQELSSAGVDFHLKPTDFDGTRIAFFKDPNGIDIEILHPLPQDLLRG